MKKTATDLAQELYKAQLAVKNCIYNTKRTRFDTIAEKIEFQITTDVTEPQLIKLVRYIESSFASVISVSYNRNLGLVTVVFYS